MKIKEKNLRKLVILCTYNIKGLIKNVEIRQLLPIKNDILEIYEDSNMLIIKSQKRVIGEILADNNMYSNLRILTLITPFYGVNCEGFRISELMKYRNNIIAVLI